MSALSMAFTAISAISQLKQAGAQKQQYEFMASQLETQAQFSRFNAKQESLKHRKQAADELENTLVKMAQINAAAGAGHMDPFSGNPFGLRTRALNVGGTNYGFAKGNETITRLTGEAQANMQLAQAGQARRAGKAAYQKGVFGALFTLGTGAFNMYQTSMGGSATPQTIGMNSPASMGGIRNPIFGSGLNYGTYHGKGVFGT